VVAEEDDAVDAGVDALHHRQWFVSAGEHAGAGVEVFQQQVALGGVCFVDQHVGGAAFVEAGDDGVDVAGEQSAEALPLFGSGDDVVGPGDAGGAFHVGGDHDPHARQLSGNVTGCAPVGANR
jgi:hypothetical protein